MSTQAALPLNVQSSSPAPAAPASPAPAAPGAASPTPQPDPAPAATRPEGLPDNYWDAATNALKVDPANLVKDLKERDDLKAFKATEDSKRLTLPQTADAYKVELPKDFVAPEGVTFEIDANDARIPLLRDFAHKNGLSQDQMSGILGIYASAEVKSAAELGDARTAEVAKLGVNGPARVDAVTNWLKGVGGDDAATLIKVLEYAPVAGTVQAFERMMQKFSSQGGAGFSQQHRSQPSDEIPDFDKMSFKQQRAAQDAIAARRRVA